MVKERKTEKKQPAIVRFSNMLIGLIIVFLCVAVPLCVIAAIVKLIRYILFVL